MSSEANSLSANSSDWYSSKVEYEGEGRAEFSDPEIVLEGTVKVEFNENGTSLIKMTKLKNIYSDSLVDSDIIQILNSLYSGNPITTKAMKKVVAWRSLFRDNKCKTLRVKTLDGIFSADDGFSNVDPMPQFSFLKSEFTISSPVNAKYWVLPISNLLSDFMQRNDELENHPLRINPENRLISFDFNGGRGFIEPLNDYNERKDQLLKCQERNLITAVIVGEIGTKSIDIADLDEWFPFYFLDLLGLTTGTEVGASWIEFRDATGKLVRRVHLMLERASFSKGHRNIDEVFDRGTGKLLTAYQLSEFKDTPCLISTIKHIIRGGRFDLNLEDNMSHIFQALDGLCEYYGLNIQNLTQNLNTHQTEIVRNSLREACDEIRAEAKKSSCNSDQIDALTLIASRTENACNTVRDFGLATIDLMNRYNLHDSSIINAHYRNNPRSDGRRWHQVLSHYRGIVIHRGFFDFDTVGYDFEDVLRVKYHIHDIVIRIVLKMLCYDGTYQRGVLIPVDSKHSCSLDWVKPNTTASELGYMLSRPSRIILP